MSKSLDQQHAELTIEIGRRTREHAVIDEAATVPSYGTDRRLHIRQEDLDAMDDAALGELVTMGLQMDLAALLR